MTKVLNSTVDNVAVIPKSVTLSRFALFVVGDIKGGEAAHVFRMATIATAIEQCFKNNPAPMREAAKLSDGKAKKARAYYAGFAALGLTESNLGMLATVPYKGALDGKDNAVARALIADKTHHAVIAFETAFNAVMSVKPIKKESPVINVAPDTVTPDNPEDDIFNTAATAEKHNAAVAVDTKVTEVASMIDTGMLTNAQLEELTEAIARFHAMKEATATAATAAIATAATAAKEATATAAKQDKAMATAATKKAALIAAQKVDTASALFPA